MKTKNLRIFNFFMMVKFLRCFEFKGEAEKVNQMAEKIIDYLCSRPTGKFSK